MLGGKTKRWIGMLGGGGGPTKAGGILGRIDSGRASRLSKVAVPADLINGTG